MVRLNHGLEFEDSLPTFGPKGHEIISVFVSDKVASRTRSTSKIRCGRTLHEFVRTMANIPQEQQPKSRFMWIFTSVLYRYIISVDVPVPPRNNRTIDLLRLLPIGLRVTANVRTGVYLVRARDTLGIIIGPPPFVSPHGHWSIPSTQGPLLPLTPDL